MTGFKKIMAVFLFAAMTAALFAQMNPRLGILPFTGGKDGEGETMALFFSLEPGLLQGFTVIPRISTLETITRDPQFSQSTGLTDADAIIRLGRPFNVDYVMAGHIRSLEEDNLILITIFQVERLRLIAGTYRLYREVEELRAMIPDMIRRLTAASKNNAPFTTPRLSVLPVMVPPGIDLDDAKLLSHILITEIANSGRYSVQPRFGAVQTIMAEQRIKHAASAVPMNIKTIGRALNVQQVLSGDFRLFNKNQLFIASVLNTADASQRAGGVVAYQSLADGIELMRELEAALGPLSRAAAPPGAPPPASEAPPPEDALYPAEDAPYPAAGASAAPAPLPLAAMVLVQGGVFQMGSRYSTPESPIHEVEISSFYIGRNEVTQEEWTEIMGDNPSYFKGPRFPVENISWYDAVEYCNKRSVKEGLTPAYQGSGDSIVCDFTASGYRLPTEAEWEYAARSETTTAYNTGNTITGEQARFGGGSTSDAGHYPANSFGLYDMHGNVFEWCWDFYGPYSVEDQTNPAGAEEGGDRVLRGGGSIDQAQHLRSALRVYYPPSTKFFDVGFRVVRSNR